MAESCLNADKLLVKSHKSRTGERCKQHQQGQQETGGQHQQGQQETGGQIEGGSRRPFLINICKAAAWAKLQISKVMATY